MVIFGVYRIHLMMIASENFCISGIKNITLLLNTIMTCFSIHSNKNVHIQEWMFFIFYLQFRNLVRYFDFCPKLHV